MSKDDHVSLGGHRARCGACSHLFEAFRVSVFLHGERLIYTADGSAFVYVNTTQDPMVREVKEILAEMGVSLADTAAVDLALLAASDALSGKPLDPARSTPVCPKCGSSEVTVEPERFRSTHLPVPPLGHSDWAKLGPEEKRKKLQAAINRGAGG